MTSVFGSSVQKPWANPSATNSWLPSAAHDAGVDRQRMVFLNERSIDAVLAQHILAKDLGEKAARVAMADRPDLLDVGNRGRNHLHARDPDRPVKLEGPLRSQALPM